MSKVQTIRTVFCLFNLMSCHQFSFCQGAAFEKLGDEADDGPLKSNVESQKDGGSSIGTQTSAETGNKKDSLISRPNTASQGGEANSATSARESPDSTSSHPSRSDRSPDSEDWRGEDARLRAPDRPMGGGRVGKISVVERAELGERLKASPL